MRYLLALDQGTTSSRAIVFDSDLAVRGVAQKEFKQIFPRDGWVEHDPHEIWQSQREVAIEAIANARIPPAEIAGLGITNQRETTLVWDRASGEPIHNAIVWQDRRTADQCEALRRRGKEEFIQTTTGLLLDPYFSASKIAWLLDHCEGARAAAVEGRLAFGTVDSWLVWKLTGGKRHLTDHSNASRTMLYNIGTGAWDDELLELWNIPRALLPDIVDSGGVCGETTELTDDAIPIAGIAGDQHAALFGQACFEPGSAKCTYGTGCFILLNTGPAIVRSTTRLLTTVAWSIEGAREFALEGSVFMGGAAVQWLRDGLGIIADASAVEMLANQVADSGGVVMVPAFTGLGAPHWDPDARGAIFGLTRGSTAAHIARATLEGIAFQVADVIDAMREDAGQVLVELKVDGGATANDTLMQFQADLLATELMRPQNPESTALGAAALAGLGVGLFAGREAISRLWRAGKSFSPRSDGEALQPARQRWRVALERSKNWATEAGGG